MIGFTVQSFFNFLKLLALKLPLSARGRLENYLSNKTPVYFFIANDGGHTLSWVCLEDYCDYDGEVAFKEAQHECETLRLGMGCTLLYVGRDPINNSLNFDEKLTSVQLSGDISI